MIAPPSKPVDPETHFTGGPGPETDLLRLTTKERLADNVRLLMDAKGESTRDLAKKVGYSHVSIHRVVTARCETQLMLAYRIARRYGVTVDDLLSDPGELREKIRFFLS